MPSPSPSATPSNPPGDSKRRTLLIVDDEEGPRQSLRILFKDEYELVLADSGARALELLRQHRVDAAVLDIRMSGMTGTELLGRIKQVDPAVEVVMLTAYETIDTMRQSLRHGACDYLTKPFDVSTMRGAVARAMARRALGDEVRASEEQLQQLRQDIEQERMTGEMARQKGEIYASVLHDINNPLTVIASVIELLKHDIEAISELPQENVSSIREQLGQVSRQVSNCGQISRRYLAFLRQRHTPGSTVSVNQVLTDLQVLLRNHPTGRGHQFRVTPLEADARVSINGTDLIQILLNLVINAFQASAAPHEVDVSARLVGDASAIASTPDGPCDVLLTPDEGPPAGACVRLSVRDNGPGMPSEVLARVFEPYFTTRENGQGTGLGLAIVHRLTKAGGGLLHVHSEPGKGTTFTLCLPVAPAPPAAPQA